MQVVVLLLLVVSLALLVSGLITGSTPLVVVSIVASVLAVYTISRYRNRQPAAVPPAGSSTAGVPAAGSSASADRPGRAVSTAATGAATSTARGAASPAGRGARSADGVAASPTARGVASTDDVATSAAAAPADRAAAPGESEPAPSISESEPVRAADLIARQARAQAMSVPDGVPAEKARAARHGAATVPEAATAAAAVSDPEPGAARAPGIGQAAGGEPDGDGEVATDEPPVAETDPPLRSRGDEPVWVIDGRPRYHLASCGFLHDRESESVPLRQAVEDGFTPCALCDPDSGLVAAANHG